MNANACTCDSMKTLDYFFGGRRDNVDDDDNDNNVDDFVGRSESVCVEFT